MGNFYPCNNISDAKWLVTRTVQEAIANRQRNRHLTAADTSRANLKQSAAFTTQCVSGNR